MAFTETLDDFLSDFGVDAVIGAATVRGILDNAFLSSLGFTAGTGPVLLLPTASSASVVQGDAVTVAAASYTVTGIEPDGTGMTLLRLQEA